MEIALLVSEVSYRSLPAVNAVLNSLAAVLLVTGYYYIRRRKVIEHYRAMWAALGLSALFLVSYVSYHTLRQMDEGVGHTVFMLEGPIRSVYYTVLVSHIILAFSVVPLALVTVYRGWTGLRNGNAPLVQKHRRIARWTLPIWLYVSVTGVIVYLMLYHIPGAAG